MNDTELLRIAAFKLHDAAQRILTLACVTDSSELNTRLRSISRQLTREELHLHTLMDQPRTISADVVTRPKSAARKKAA